MADNSEIIQDALQKAGIEAVKNIVLRIPKATGQTASRVRSRVKDLSLELIGPDYIWALEYGRGPTIGGGDGSLVDKIGTWIEAKGLDLNRYAVSKVIHETGTKLYKGKDARYPGAKGSEGIGSEVLTGPVEDIRQELIKEIGRLLAESMGAVISRPFKKVTV